MFHKVPIRTYSKKNRKELTVTLSRLHSPIQNNINNKESDSLATKFNEIEDKGNANNSMYYDPLDTTFDRLLKDTKPPFKINKSHNSISWDSSKNTSCSFNVSKSKEANDKYSVKGPTKSDIDIISIPERKVGRPPKNKNMQVLKKTITTKHKVLHESNGKLKVKKSNFQKNHTLHKKKNKRIVANNSNIGTLYSNSRSNVSNLEDYFKDGSNVKGKGNNKKKISRQKEIKDDKLNLSRGLELKPCSVLVKRCDNSLHCNKISKKNLSKESQKYILGINESIVECEINNKISNSKYNTLNIKHCFVKIDKLYSDIKSFDKRHENVVSSTPIGKPVIHRTHFLTLSPIPSQNFKQLSIPITRINHISCSTQNRISVSTTSKERKHLTPVEIFKEETKLFSSNTSHVSDSSINQLRKLSKNGTNSLTAFNCLENIVQETNAQINDCSLDMFSSLKENIVNIKKVQCSLNFSADADKSRSLFSGMEESMQSLEHDVDAASKAGVLSTNNLISNITCNEITNKSFKKESTPNIKNSTIEITFDKIEKETSHVTIQISDDSLDKESKLEIKAADNEYRSGRNENNKRDNLSKSDTLCISNSSIRNKQNCSILECTVLLKQLQDPVRLTRKRKEYRHWDLPRILEDGNNHIQSEENQLYSDKENRNSDPKIRRIGSHLLENIPETFIDSANIEVLRPIYLKPGKSWLRSLSILNNIQNESTLERFSHGKGKNWRSSVQDVLDMQKQGIIQSCVKRKEDDKDSQVVNETLNKSEHKLTTNRGRTCDSISLGRLSRRISVRVIPINKTVKSIQDVSFLEAYGIVPVKNDRFTLVTDERKYSVCNIKNDDVDGQIVEDQVTSTAKDVILNKCMQKDYIPFSTYFSESYLEHCRKIGEGVYGEVFLHEHEDERSVIKIIPIEGSECVNGEPQKKFHEILSEIVIAMELHNLRSGTKYNTDGFVEVKNINCIKGKYPDKFVEFWNVYDEEKHSDNDCPSMFNDDQLYIVLELGHGGQDLEAFVFNTAEEAHALFIQTALALAVAEKALQFEHRDLHWGNILISTTEESHMYYKLGKKHIKVLTKGVKVSIIDFTLSRVTYEGCSIFNDLASDPTLFTAQGEYQFEIYRLMRDKVKNNWQRFEPYTNILWLHYTLDKMITAVRYRKKNLKSHKNGVTKLKQLKSEVLMYNSALDFVTNCDKIVNLLCNYSKSEHTSISQEE